LRFWHGDRAALLVDEVPPAVGTALLRVQVHFGQAGCEVVKAIVR
jgi:hypothetical protein